MTQPATTTDARRYEFLETVRSELDKCTKCASCQAGCPTYELTESETLVARGKIRLARAVADGGIDLSDRIKRDFGQCLSCMNCLEACPSGVNTMAVFSAMRQEIVKREGPGKIAGFIFKNLLAHPARLNLLAKLVGVATLFYKAAPSWLARHLPFSPSGTKRVTPDFLKRNLRSRVAEVTPPARGVKPLKRVAFFSGCMTDLAFPETGRRVIDALAKAGVEVVFPKGQVCCGAPAYFTGDVDQARLLARRNVEVLSELGVDAVVYSCATCGSVLGETYPEILPDDPRAKELAEKTVDFQKLLVDLSLERILGDAAEGGRKVRVTYHDPCHLRRGMGTFKEPRNLIRSLPHVQFVEMEGANSCCGGSGTFSLKHYEMAMEQGARKAGWVKASGADLLVTACPSCQLQLADALHRAGVAVPVLHTADLVALALDGSLERVAPE